MESVSRRHIAEDAPWKQGSITQDQYSRTNLLQGFQRILGDHALLAVVKNHFSRKWAERYHVWSRCHYRTGIGIEMDLWQVHGPLRSGYTPSMFDTPLILPASGHLDRNPGNSTVQYSHQAVGRRVPGRESFLLVEVPESQGRRKGLPRDPLSAKAGDLGAGPRDIPDHRSAP
jgi:hypothetical protein